MATDGSAGKKPRRPAPAMESDQYQSRRLYYARRTQSPRCPRRRSENPRRQFRPASPVAIRRTAGQATLGRSPLQPWWSFFRDYVGNRFADYRFQGDESGCHRRRWPRPAAHRNWKARSRAPTVFFPGKHCEAARRGHCQQRSIQARAGDCRFRETVRGPAEVRSRTTIVPAPYWSIAGSPVTGLIAASRRRAHRRKFSVSHNRSDRPDQASPIAPTDFGPLR